MYFQGENTHQLVQSDLWSVFRDGKPPGSGSHSGSAHVAWKQTHRNITLVLIYETA